MSRDPDGEIAKLRETMMRPAVFIDPRTGRVVKEGCQSVGCDMTLDGEAYCAVGLFGMWVYFPQRCNET